MYFELITIRREWKSSSRFEYIFTNEMGSRLLFLVNTGNNPEFQYACNNVINAYLNFALAIEIMCRVICFRISTYNINLCSSTIPIIVIGWYVKQNIPISWMLCLSLYYFEMHLSNYILHF